ncbi:tyrosine-protein phosphatase Lar-like isoform X2 [Hyposmocoma kahamanoa]|uniref:tyrosine-protein phosphatase Lar-like isoform X2 n=1 Tax=Hyposmocoma kahamanoa TaxID=1477025 RepID=UPI000E6D65A8|nr:tyrosine-protein phosphatase Lar-like isoform X2 [Hyposmocoma kahamanoa]
MAGKGFGGEVVGFFLAVAFCVTCPEYVSSAQRELGKSLPSNASATAPPVGTVDNAIRTGVAVEPPRPTPRTGPYFDLAASKNVTALLGKTAYLNCRVKNLGNKTLNMQVSWVRHRDIHLLTVGRYTYTSDQRFRAIHLPHSEDWTLQIKYPQHRDSGIYECQISTTPHMSHFIHLNVVEPTTEIIGGPDLYIDRGSTINLTCVVLYSPEPPAYIFWNHNDAIISYDSPRGGVSVVTEKGETTTSFLLIQQARPSDSGTYQCNPSNAQSKSIVVHVLNANSIFPLSGEYPAAMQRGGQAFAPTSPAHCIILVACLLITLS